jgi:predicted phage-related endonuclease
MSRFTVIDAPQRSHEWRLARVGKLTGSRAMDMLAQTQKKEWAAARKNLKALLVLERITGKSQESDFQSDAMRDGIEREDVAFRTYEAVVGTALQTCGFLSLNGHAAGCSLDGYVGEFEGIVEAKSPMAATHLDYLRSGKVPGDYYRQVLHNLWVTGAQWCDWFSFHPDFPEHMQIKCVRVERNEDEIADYEKKALAFLAEVDAEVASILTSTDLRAALTGAA